MFCQQMLMMDCEHNLSDKIAKGPGTCAGPAEKKKMELLCYTGTDKTEVG